MRVHERLEDPLVGVNLHNSAGEHVWGANNELDAERSASSRPARSSASRCASRTSSAPDRYWVTPAVATSERRPRLARPPHALRLGHGHRDGIRREGVVDLPFEIEVERSQPAGQPAHEVAP